MSPRRLLILLCALTLPLAAQLEPQFENRPQPVGPDRWQLSWSSIPGITYTLERSYDLIEWEEVGTVQAEAEVSTLIDESVEEGAPHAFWRVVAHITGGELTIGDVAVNYQLAGEDSSVTYTVVAGGPNPISRVVLYNDGIELGDATPGIGDSWSLTLDWDPALPETHRIEAEAVTEDESARSPLRGILLADPEFFVPITPEGDLLPGQLVPVAPDGSLGEFRFYPEGTRDLESSTGAFFEFVAGATLNELGGTNNLIFSDGSFFRGPLDVDPVDVIGGLRMLDLDDISLEQVQNAFDLPALPITLDWGSGTVAWTEGSLGLGGWQNLQVEFPLGDFELPGDCLNARVGVDPDSRELFLSVCYFGEWVPQEGGPIFRIPEDAPLTIYYSKTGGLAAHGTAEAEFPDAGSKVRGSISWVAPNFEFSFEGRGIVIPTLDSLRDLLPTEPGAAVPSGNDPAELDKLAAQLQGYRDAFQGIALGGTSQASPTGEGSLSTPPSPTDAAGAALRAWSGRIRSWAGDRSGQDLEASQLDALSKVVKQACRTGEGAHDLPTVLKLLEELLVLTKPLDAIRGDGPISDALVATIGDGTTRLLATAERLAEKPTTEITQDIKASALLLQNIDRLIQDLDEAEVGAPGDPAPGLAISPYRARYQRISRTYKNGLDRGIWIRLSIETGDFTGSNNNTLQAMDEEELLAVLDSVLGTLDVLRAESSVIRRVSHASGSADSPPLHEAWRQVQDVFETKHFETTSSAMQAGDFARVRRALAIRARYFELHEKLGETLASNDDDIRPLTALLMDRYLELQGKLPAAVQVITCSSDASVFARLSDHSQDQGTAEDLSHKINTALECLDLLSDRNGAQVECDVVYALLREDGLSVPNPNESADGTRTVRMTGRYEDVDPGTTYFTMQLNQASRLLLGWYQTHPTHKGLSNRSTRTKRLIGMLKSETANTAEYHVLLRENDGSFLGSRTLDKKILRATKTANGVTIVESPLPGVTGSSITWLKTTTYPTFSPTLSNLFQGEAKDIFLAQQRAPLHSNQIRAVRGHHGTILAEIENYLAAGSAARAGIAQTIGRKLQNLSHSVSTTQVPLARQIVREMLSRTEATSDGDRLTHWNWLRVIFSRHFTPGPLFDEFRTFMGPDITAANNFDTFKYEISIEEGGLTIGDYGLKGITINMVKTRTDGAGGASIINLVGGLGQGGAGLSLKGIDVGGGAGGDEVVMYTDIEYSEQVLAGPIMLYGATAGAGIGITDVSVGPTILVLYGDFTLPPFVIPLPFVDNDNTIQTPSLEMNFGLGGVKGASDVPARALALTAEPADQSSTANAGTVGAIHFDVGTATLRQCGYSSLRNLVAEMRAIFESEDSTISILGFTDATGIAGNTSAQNDTYNDGLSQARADKVKSVLTALVGEGLSVPPDKIRAIGLGRRPSMGLTSAKENLLNDVEKDFLAKKKLTTPQLVDGQANQEWRTVVVILNNLVSIDLGSEGTAANQ